MERYCFYKCLSVILFTGGIHPPGRHPPGQTPPSWADTPLGTPPEDTPCPVHARIHTHPCTVHAGTHTHPSAQCMLGYMPPPYPVHAGIHTPLSNACCDTWPPCRSLLQTVRILLECILVSFCTPMKRTFSVLSLIHLYQEATYLIKSDIIDVMRDVSLEYKSRLRLEVRNNASTV